MTIKPLSATAGAFIHHEEANKATAILTIAALSSYQAICLMQCRGSNNNYVIAQQVR